MSREEELMADCKACNRVFYCHSIQTLAQEHVGSEDRNCGMQDKPSLQLFNCCVTDNLPSPTYSGILPCDILSLISDLPF